MNKYKKGQLVRFTEYNTFGESDHFGYIMDYYGKSMGLRHYMIREYTGKEVYMRTFKYIKSVSKEEEFLLFLERK